MQNIHMPADHLTSGIGRGTEKLYYSDAYLREFDAVVLECTPIYDKEYGSPSGQDDDPVRYAVVLDRTAFFPEEGGQSPDRGTLTAENTIPAGSSPKQGETVRVTGIQETSRVSDIQETAFVSDAQKTVRIPDAQKTAQVLDVQIHDGIIIHTTDIPFSPGTRVHGILDFRHRFSNMQQHSAEHLFSGLLYSRLGLANVGFHLSDSEVTMDYPGQISSEVLSELELEVNRLIWKDIESRQEFPTPEELASYDYRSKAAISGQVRLVIFPGCDICACCAPHVARTGEIGLFRILSVQSHRGGVRVHMLAGERAFLYLAQENAILTAAARSLSTSADQVPERIAGLRADLSEAKHLLAEARLALLLKEAGSIPASCRSVCLFSEGLEEPVLREAVNRLMEKHAGVCGIFNGNDSSGYRYVIGSQSDVLRMQQRLKEDFQARGGGKPPMIQGQIHAAEAEIRPLFEDPEN